MNLNAAMVCQHDTLSVVLATLVSILAARAARDLAGRINLRCQRFGEPVGYKPDSL
jgi:NO-binding membrane sensor protein with MHYT domain